jgi:hypothetical protein
MTTQALPRRAVSSAGSRALLATAVAALVLGLGTWLGGLLFESLQASVIAVWCFVVCSAALGAALPLRGALVAPLFVGTAGWLVDMLPLVVLAGWGAVVARWCLSLWRERRMPRGGRLLWLPVALVVWTSLGITVLSDADLRHFMLLLGIQVLLSGTVLVVVDRFRTPEERLGLCAGLAGFVVLLTAGAFLQWTGVPLQSLQYDDASRRLEDAYGLDAFPNNVGMVNYVRAVDSGAGRLRARLERARQDDPRIPPFAVFRPRFGAWPEEIVVRFGTSARHVERALRRFDVVLVHDNVGLAPGDTVPRMRSFPRNSLTYAGVSAALFPVGFALSWLGRGWRRRLGVAAVVGCLFGAAFSLARGAWVAIAIGVVYLCLGRALSGRRKLAVIAAYLVAALVLTTVFVLRYSENPVTARAGAQGSVGTRRALYEETADALSGIHFVIGFGTEKPRAGSGVARYVPRAGTHSTYLNYLFRTGLPGALGIAALYAIAWLHAHAASRLRREPQRVLELCLAAAVLSAAAHAVILSLYVEPVYTLTISLLLGLALAGNDALARSVLPWRWTRSRS